MFWKVSNKKPSAIKEGKRKLPKPRAIVNKVGRYLINEEYQNPDLVWSLESVTLPDEVEPKRVNFRVFDAAAVAVVKVDVRDYHSLDAHPALILWEGWYSKDDYHVFLTKEVS